MTVDSRRVDLDGLTSVGDLQRAQQLLDARRAELVEMQHRAKTVVEAESIADEIAFVDRVIPVAANRLADARYQVEQARAAAGVAREHAEQAAVARLWLSIGPKLEQIDALAREVQRARRDAVESGLPAWALPEMFDEPTRTHRTSNPLLHQLDVLAWQFAHDWPAIMANSTEVAADSAAVPVS